MGICKSTCSIRCKYFYSSQRLCRIDIIKTSCRGFQWDRYLNTFLNSELKNSVTTGKSMLILLMTHTIMKIECPIKWGNEKIVSKSWPTLVGKKLKNIEPSNPGISSNPWHFHSKVRLEIELMSSDRAHMKVFSHKILWNSINKKCWLITDL